MLERGEILSRELATRQRITKAEHPAARLVMSPDSSVRARGVRLGVAVRDLRQRRGLTRADVAQRAQISPETVARAERGETWDPRLSTIAALASALSISAARLTDVFVTAEATSAADVSRWPLVHVPPRGQASSAADLAAVLRGFRVDAGLKIGELAIRAGIGQSTLRRIETGHRQRPELLVIARLALGIDGLALRDLSAAAGTLAALACAYSGELPPSVAIRARRDQRASEDAERHP